MSFAARLVHSLTIVRTTFDFSTESEYGQPEQTVTTLPVAGLVQPKTAREMADSRGAGSEVADHTIFLLPQLLYGSDSILDTGGQRYQITDIRSFEFGRTPHLEVDAVAVVASNDNQVEVGS
jgi:hypothetical protein